MTTWILWIKAEHPEHWEFAKREKFWDTPYSLDISQDDDIFLWQAGRRVRAWVRATSAAQPLSSSDGMPWNDAGTAGYKRRFEFELISDEPRSTRTWAQTVNGGSVSGIPRNGYVSTQDSVVLYNLKHQFQATGRVDFTYPTDAVQVHLEDLLTDTRHRAERTIALRQGQPAFRADLLRAYQSKCAVTGYHTVDVLEAAHISPYLGGHTNGVTNGLLLRADIHTLFDRHLITIDQHQSVRIAPSLHGTPYEHLDGAPLASVPSSPADRPSEASLESHRVACEWYARVSDSLF